MIVKKTRLIISLGVLISLVLLGGVYVYHLLIKRGIPTPELITENQGNQGNKANHQPCLSENEQADFKIERLGQYPSVEYDKGFIEVIVKDVATGKETTRLKIDDIINPSHYHPVEIHKCGVYVIKEFNFDFEKYKPLPGFSVEFWRYQYNGDGEKLLILAGENRNTEAKVDYSYDFRIDPHETYLVLEKGYLGREDYSLVIKNLKTKEDVFTLLAKSIAEQHPNIIGVFDMREWSENGRYFWASISDGAYVNGYLRIDIQDRKVDIYEAPDGAMGGMPLNINTGYVPIQPGLVWTGDYQLTQEIKEKERKEGKKSSLYLYNLFTKEKILIETTDEPQFFFKPKWLSDAELEYYLPSGERRVYNLVKR